MEQQLISRVKSYNEELKQVTSDASSIAARISFTEEDLVRRCKDLSDLLGIEVTVDNLEGIYQREIDKVENILNTGEEILKRIREGIVFDEEAEEQEKVIEQAPVVEKKTVKPTVQTEVTTTPNKVVRRQSKATQETPTAEVTTEKVETQPVTAATPTTEVKLVTAATPTTEVKPVTAATPTTEVKPVEMPKITLPVDTQVQTPVNTQTPAPVPAPVTTPAQASNPVKMGTPITQPTPAVKPQVNTPNQLAPSPFLQAATTSTLKTVMNEANEPTVPPVTTPQITPAAPVTTPVTQPVNRDVTTLGGTEIMDV